MTVQINHPDYYKSGKYEAIDYIEAHNLNFNLGNVIKYVTRAGRKDSNIVTDLSKARWYLDREISRYPNPDDYPVPPFTPKITE